ncbi:hypothetical protein D3C76_533760 [compost metagenome]
MADQPQVSRFDLPAFGQHQAATYPVGQFAHIARPVMLAHGNQGVFTEATRAAAGFTAIEMGKMVGQHRQVTIALTQGRGRDLQHVQAVIQVFAKAFLLDRRLQIDMGCRQHPYIHGDRLATANPFDVFFLEEAQQARLQLKGQIADLVEKQRAAVSRFDPPDLALMGAGKGPLLMAKQFGLDQVLGNRPAVDRDKGFAVAQGLPMQRTGH